jgi:hypothetical protein
MVINNSTTSISFYPFVDFGAIATATIEVWHKPTKEMVTTTGTITRNGTRINITMPDMTSLDTTNLDMMLIRIYNGDTLYWEYLATWSDGNTNINNSFKTWQTTTGTTPQWVTI